MNREVDRESAQGSPDGAEGAVIALAGRRTDAPDSAAVRFPLEAVSQVRSSIRDCLEREHAVALVSSAAAGADLLAQDVAAELGLRRCVVLPFAAARFRDTSVIDRSGFWGELFDRLCADGRDDVTIVDMSTGGIADDDAYALANERILHEAERLADRIRAARIAAVLVWDGVWRGTDDATASFGDLARERGHPVIDISTLPGA
jgi:hypothetical protein